MKKLIIMGVLSLFLLACDDDTTVDTCGDGVVDPSEDCDPEAVSQSLCTEIGYWGGGAVSCNADCTYDYSTCEGRCGDGDIQSEFSEECDGTNLANKPLCSDHPGLTGNTQVSCGSDCRFDLSMCESKCGNGTLDDGEDCDGTVPESFDDCGEHDPYLAGNDVTCNSDCTFNFDQCLLKTCGNNQIDEGEDCEVGNLQGEDCTNHGFYAGTLACTNCHFDTVGCVGRCGDNNISHDEDCDGDQMGTATCESLGYYGGTIACNSACSYDISDCIANGYCGDGILQAAGTETCDGTDFGNADCSSFGFFNPSEPATLLCSDTCTATQTGCSNFVMFGTSAEDTAKGVVVDNAGNVYVTGQTSGTMSTSVGMADAFLAKYNTSGHLQWRIQFGGNADDSGNALLINSSGNIIVVGETQIPFRVAIFLKEFDPDGVEIASIQYTNTGNAHATSIATDGNNNYIIAGFTDGNIDIFPEQTNAGFNDILILKYNNNLELLWQKLKGTDGDDKAFSIAAKSDGTFFIAGSTTSTFTSASADGFKKAMVFYYNADGSFPQDTYQWDSYQANVSASAVAYYNDHVYVVGQTEGPIGSNLYQGTGPDSFIAKLTLNSNSFSQDWVWQYGGTVENYAVAVYALANSARVVGNCSGSMFGNPYGGSSDFYYISIDTTENININNQYGLSSSDIATAVTTSNFGTFITGTTDGELAPGGLTGSTDPFLFRIF